MLNSLFFFMRYLLMSTEGSFSLIIVSRYRDIVMSFIKTR